MRKFIRRKSVIFFIAVLVLASFFTIYNQTQAGSVKDVMSRLKQSTAANHEITFHLGLTDDVTENKIIDITFAPGFASGLNGIDCGDVDLLAGAIQKNLNTVAGGCTATATLWGAAVSGRTLTLTAPSNPGTYIAGGSDMIIRIGTNATEGETGDTQIVNPAAVGDYLIRVDGTFGDSGTVAIAILANEQVGVGGTVNPITPPGGGGSPGSDTSPPIVTNLRVENILQNSASVLWDTNEPATSEVHYGLTDSYGSSTTGDGGLLVTSHRVDLSGLAAATIYHYEVLTADALGHETITADDVFTTLSGVDTTPPVISNIQVLNITETSADVTWQTDEPANSKVEYGLTNSYELGQVTDASFVAAHTLALTGLSINTLYHFRVTSADAAGNTTVSDDSTFTTLAPPDLVPPIISNIRVTNITETSVTVTWQTDEPASSRVKYGLTGAYAAGNIYSAILTTSHSVDLSSLTRSTVYHFEVSSADASGNLATSPDQIFSTLPDVTPPANVSDFTATPTPTQTVLLAWTNPTDPDFAGVLIKRSFTDFPATPADGEIVFDGVGTSVEDTGITSVNYNKPIYYTAFAYDASGNYSSGAMAEATVMEEITLNVKAWPEKRWPRTDHWQTTAVVDLQDPLPAPHVVAEETVTTSDIGEGTVTFSGVPLQTYNVGFKGISDLRKTISGISLATGAANIDFTMGGTFYLKAGDVHRSHDNIINALDLSAMLATLSGANDITDLNQDSTVNSLDINILLANLMVRGDE